MTTAPASSALFNRYTFSSYRLMDRLYSLSSLPYRCAVVEPSTWCITRPITGVDILCMSRNSDPPIPCNACSPRAVRTRLIERPAEGIVRRSS